MTARRETIAVVGRDSGGVAIGCNALTFGDIWQKARAESDASITAIAL